MFGVRKFIKNLNAIERIALVLSVFYGLGVVSLIQFNGLFNGGECLDFLRIKPILVGVQYLIYLMLPAMIVCAPAYYLKHCRGRNWWWKMVVAFALVMLALLVPGIVFHYFIPFTYVDSADEGFVFYLKVPIKFWSLFFYWDVCHVIGMIISVALFLMLVCKKNAVSKRLLLVWMFFAATWNLFFFNRDMYANIAQSAGGGAPRAGIITIVNPTEMMKRANVDYMTEENEISKPCFVLEEGDDYFIIAEMFGNYPDRQVLSETDIRASATRIDRSSVKQFSPINLHLGFRDWKSPKYCKNLEFDIVHQLDVVLNLFYTPTDLGLMDAWSVPEIGTMTNEVSLAWWPALGAVVSARSHDFSVCSSGSTDVLQQIKFNGVPFPRGVYVWTIEDQLKDPRLHIRVQNLPDPPVGFKYHHVQLVFICNFVYGIQGSWSGTFTNDGALLIKPKDAPTEGMHDDS